MKPLSPLSFWKKGTSFSAATSRPWELCFSLFDNGLYMYFQEKKKLAVSHDLSVWVGSRHIEPTHTTLFLDFGAWVV